MKKTLLRLSLALAEALLLIPSALADEIYEPPPEAVSGAGPAPYLIAAAAAVIAVIVLALVIRRRKTRRREKK